MNDPEIKTSFSPNSNQAKIAEVIERRARDDEKQAKGMQQLFDLRERINHMYSSEKRPTIQQLRERLKNSQPFLINGMTVKNENKLILFPFPDNTQITPDSSFNLSPDSSYEKIPSQETKEKTQALMGEIEKRIYEVYGLSGEDLPNAADFLWNGSPNELKQALNLDSLNPSGSIYSLDTPDGQNLGTILYLSPFIMETVTQTSITSLIERGVPKELLTVIEEVSHFVFDAYYRKQFGTKSHSALFELIAVLDKNNILQKMYAEKLGRTMLTKEQRVAIAINAQAAVDPAYFGITTGEYLVGHQLGLQFISYLNGEFNQGRDPSQELVEFYKSSNKDQLTALLYNHGFSIHTYSQKEEQAVLDVMKRVGVHIYKAAS